MLRYWLSLVVPCVLSVLTACTSAVLLSNVEVTSPGLNYFLPKTLLTITIEAIGRNVGEGVAQLSAEEISVAGQNGVVRVPVRLDGRTHSVLVNKDGQLVQPLVTSLRIASIKTEQVADLSNSYVLQYAPSSVHSDRVCMGVNERGLLRYVEAATKDETANIIVSIAKFGGRLAGPTAFTAGAPQKIPDLDIEIKVDPYNESDSFAASQTIENHFPELRGRFRLHVDKPPRGKASDRRNACRHNSICYRTVVPVRVGLFDHEMKRTSVRYVDVANVGETNNIDVSRAFMVEKVTRFGFAEGMLQYAIIRKPSETLEVARLPLTVYDAIMTSALAAPGQFLGQIAPGADPAAVIKVLEAQRDAAKETVELQQELERYRRDIAPGGPLQSKADEEVKFKIACAGPLDKEKVAAAGGH